MPLYLHGKSIIICTQWWGGLNIPRTGSVLHLELQHFHSIGSKNDRVPGRWLQCLAKSGWGRVYPLPNSEWASPSELHLITCTYSSSSLPHLDTCAHSLPSSSAVPLVSGFHSHNPQSAACRTDKHTDGHQMWSKLVLKRIYEIPYSGKIWWIARSRCEN